jgi:hypothetical protein
VWFVWVSPVILSAVVVVASLPAGGSAAGSRPQADHLQISPITAFFSEANRSTAYSFETISDPDADAKLTFQWSLTLQAVDPSMGVDLPCNNRGKLGGTDTTFTWLHGNSGDPVRDDGCDHMKQGKYGHQGLISVIVDDSRGWSCSATYKGTLSTVGNPNPDAASHPVCSYTDLCEDQVETFERATEEYGAMELVRKPLVKAGTAALYEVRRAEAALTELKGLGDPGLLAKAKADVKEAYAGLSKAVGTLSKWDHAEFDPVEESLDRNRRALAACRARTDPPPAARALGWGADSSADCTKERIALARARGRVDAYRLLRPLAKIKLDPAARRIRSATAILQKASATPRTRRLLRPSLGHLKASGVLVKAAKSQVGRVVPAFKAAVAHKAEAQSNLARCESGD